MSKLRYRNRRLQEKYKYLKTFLLTLLGVITFSIVSMLFAYYYQNPDVSHKKDSEKELISYLIKKYTLEEIKNPKDYIINLKLGFLYQANGDLDEAEVNFIKSIEKKPYKVYSPDFNLAELYIKQKKTDKAVVIVNNIKDFYSIELFYQKGLFYLHLGDDFVERRNYTNAISMYETSAFYFRKVPKYNFAKLNNKIIDCYINIAQEEIAQSNISQGLKLLNKAAVHKKHPLINYKLALLYYELEPEKSLKYLEKTFDKDPTIINYDLYTTLLDDLILKSKQENNNLAKQLYEAKKANLERFINNTLVNQEDFEIKLYKKKFSKIPFQNKYKTSVEFSIINKTQKPANYLCIKTEIIDDEGIVTAKEQKVKFKHKDLKYNEESKKIKIKQSLNYTIKDYELQKAGLNVYIAKNNRIKKTYIETIPLWSNW